MNVERCDRVSFCRIMLSKNVEWSFKMKNLLAQLHLPFNSFDPFNALSFPPPPPNSQHIYTNTNINQTSEKYQLIAMQKFTGAMPLNHTNLAIVLLIRWICGIVRKFSQYFEGGQCLVFSFCKRALIILHVRWTLCSCSCQQISVDFFVCLTLICTTSKMTLVWIKWVL